MKGYGKGKKPSGPPPPPPQKGSQIYDLSMTWTVSGEPKKFDTDEEFAAAIELLKVPDKITSIKDFNDLEPFWKKDRILRALNEWDPKSLYKFPHHEVSASDIDEPIPWESCKGVQRSLVGSEGVLFVELPGKQAVVIKSPANAAAEMFGTDLCQHMGLRCPKMNAVEKSCDEGKLIFESLTKIASTEQRTKVEEVLKNSIFLIIEYLPGNALDSIPQANGVEHFEQNGEEILRFMGRCIAFDLITNNFDRLPVGVFDNPGNPGNIMLDLNGKPVSIDNVPTCIVSEKYQKDYFERVRRLTSEVVSHPKEVHEGFQRVRNFLCSGHPVGGVGLEGWQGFGVDIGEDGTILMQTVFIDAVKTICDTEDGLTVEKFKYMRESLFNLLPTEIQGETAETKHICGFEQIDIGFFSGVVETFRDALSAPVNDTYAEPLTPIHVEPEHGRNFRQAVIRRMAGQRFVDILEAKMEKLQEEKTEKFPVIAKAIMKFRRLSKEIRARSATTPFFSLEELKDPIFFESSVLAETMCRSDFVKHREDYLSDQDFLEVFGISRDDFAKLRQWQRTERKKQKGLF